MTLYEKINSAFIDALKQKQNLRLSVLRLLKTALTEKEKEKGEIPDEKTILQIIQSEIKKRQQAIEQYQTAHRNDLADQEKREKAILEEFLPEQITEKELLQIINQAINEIKPRGIQDMGKIMARVMPQVQGRATGNLVSQLVKKQLL